MKLTETDIYSLVAQLVYKNEVLEKRLSSVEDELAKIRRKQRISILSWLNSSFGYHPTVTFKEWIKMLPINVQYIEMVLKTDLLQGIVLCLKDAIFHSKIVDLPFCAFHQKNKQLYIYQESVRSESGEREIERKWTILSNDEMLSIVSILSQLFLRHYLQWKTVFLSYSASSSFLSEEREEEERKEKELNYLTKITGNDIKDIVKCRKVLETLISMVQRDFNEIEIV